MSISSRDKSSVAMEATPESTRVSSLGRGARVFVYRISCLVVMVLVYILVDQKQIALITNHVMQSSHQLLVQQLSQVDDDERAQHEDHCVIHVHGLHHSGTGFLRKTIYDALGETYASMHQKTGVAEDEGQHIQTVYPPFYERAEKCRNVTDDAAKSVARRYYCPELLEIAKKKNASETLFDEWSRYWNMTKPYLIQKTPTLDVLFLERMKTYKTVHVIIMRHPFMWRPVAVNANPGIVRLRTWLDIWAHILNLLSENQVELFAVVQYEALLTHPDIISRKLSKVIQDYCGISAGLPENDSNRRLHLHENATASNYLLPPAETWERYENDEKCRELMDELVPVMSQLGYSWDRENYFDTANTNLLFTTNKPPPHKLGDTMKELVAKYAPAVR